MDPYIKSTIGPTEKNTSSLLGQMLTFLVLVGLFSLIAESLKFHLDQQNIMLDRLTMWGPGTAALITCWLYRIDVKTLGWRWPTPGWMPLSYVIPLLYATPVYLVTWIVIDHSLALQPFMDSVSASYNFANWKVFGTFFVGIPLLLTLGVVSTITWALGEELGWRGFLFPRLVSRFGFNLACLFSGFIWAAWHYPGLIWGHYNAGTNPLFALIFFTTSVVAMAFVSGWLRQHSQSIWPSVLLHASHNLFVEGIFDPLTGSTGLARYVTTEFGIGLSITIGIAAYLLCSRTVSPRRITLPRD
jgi:membrane protease YdiL (CAAX protease family)